MSTLSTSLLSITSPLACSNVPCSACVYSTVVTKLYDTCLSFRYFLQSPPVPPRHKMRLLRLSAVRSCLQICNTRPFHSPFYLHGGIIRPFSTLLAAQESLVLRGRLPMFVPRNLPLVHDASGAHHNICEGLSATACPPTLPCTSGLLSASYTAGKQ